MEFYHFSHTNILTESGGVYTASSSNGPDSFFAENTLTPGDVIFHERNYTDPYGNITTEDQEGGFRETTKTYIGNYHEGLAIHIVELRDENVVRDEVILYSSRNYADREFQLNTTPLAACFLAGVQIMTPAGPRDVADLTSGDLVLTADGRAVPVKWVRVQVVSWIFNHHEDRAPIRIDAGALGLNLPARDLKLTADHALLIAGALVQAGALVNGLNVHRMTRAETGERYTVFHIETEGHEMILAEGCAAETFVDTVGRQRFDNYAEYVARFGEEAQAMAELDLPRVKSARQLPESLRAWVAARQAA